MLEGWAVDLQIAQMIAGGPLCHGEGLCFHAESSGGHGCGDSPVSCLQLLRRNRCHADNDLVRSRQN